MTRKRIIQIVIIVVVLCVAVGVAIRTAMVRQEEQRIEEARQMEQLQKQREEAERMKQVQSKFEELVVFAQENKEDIENFSVAVINQMREIEDWKKFDYEKAYKQADIISSSELRNELYMNEKSVFQSIEMCKDDTKLCPEITYYYSEADDGTVFFLIYLYSDKPEESWKYQGVRDLYDGYEKITENLYAIWFEPPYT